MKRCKNCGHLLEGMAAHRTHWEEGYWSCHDDFFKKDEKYPVPCRCIIYFNSKLEKELGLDKKRIELINYSKRRANPKPKEHDA